MRNCACSAASPPGRAISGWRRIHRERGAPGRLTFLQDAGGRGEIEGPHGHTTAAIHGDLPARERPLPLPGALRGGAPRHRRSPRRGPANARGACCQDAGFLRRVLRLVASAGVFAEDADGRFELTPVGSALRSGPGSSRAAARLIAGPMVWQCWGDLLTTVRTGEPAFPRIFKTDSFGYFGHHPEEAAVFDEAMSSFTASISGMIAAVYDFSGMREVIDVGGGDGRLLTGILRAHSSLRGTVFDLPRLAESARRQIASAGLADRYRFLAGDFFEAIPEGFDAYLLKHVIHDWNDAHAVHILQNCRHAMRPQAKLLIVEGVYPPHIDDSPASRGATANDVNRS